MFYVNELKVWMRLILHIPFIPIVAGLGYEVLKITAKHRNNLFFKILAKPGLWLQNITTKEPDDSQIEVAIRALEEAFGKNTAQAMLQGVYHGIKGMVRQLSEQYASRYGAYPMIVATGGDATLLFEHDEFIEHIEPNLPFKGIAVSVKHALTVDENE